MMAVACFMSGSWGGGIVEGEGLDGGEVAGEVDKTVVAAVFDGVAGALVVVDGFAVVQ